ncbi:hypothetical protein [Flavobacterium sp.]|uniref:hypothetical protein n=1 Tax=Flavobacterium sp. TaxID=239 RepID=UPI003D0B8182
MKNYSYTSNVIALLSFSFGTLLLIVYLLSKNEFLLAVGFTYVLLAIFFNLLVLVYNIHKLLYRSEKVKTLSEIGILLINVPIAYSYFLIVMNQIP